MIDLFYQIASLFRIICQGHTIIVAIILGYIWIDAVIFSHVTYLLLTSLLLNSALKMTFQVPLNPAIGKGFAFPSGHMQSSIVFYGWIFTQMRLFLYKEWALFFILMGGIGYSLIYFGYHDLRDVLGACVVGSLLLCFYTYLAQTKLSTFYTVLFLFNTALMLYIFFRHFVIEHQLVSYLMLLGMLSSHFFIAKKRLTSFWQKVGATFFSLFFFWGIRKVIIYSAMPTYLRQLDWLLVCFVIPLVANHWWFIYPLLKKS